MNQLKVNRLITTGFKNCLETKEFNLNDFTTVSGENAQGKTTIGEAIAWGLIGCDMWANEKATTRLVNNRKPKITEVVLEFTYNGELHTIIRRKKGSSTDIYLDDKKISTQDIIREFLVGKDIFFTIFNPGYFSNMTPKDAKAFLTNILKDVSQEEIFKELGDLKDLLLKNGFKNANTFLEDKRSDNAEIDKDMIYLQGIIDGQTSELTVPNELTFNDVELKKLKVDYDQLNINQEDPKLKELETKLTELRFKQNSIPFERPQLKDIKALENSKDRLLREHKEVQAEIKNLNGKTIECPECGTEIDINAEEKSRLKGRLEKISADGQQAVKDMAASRIENEKLLKNYESKVQKHQEELQKQIENAQIEIVKIKKVSLENAQQLEANKHGLKIKIEALEVQQNEVKVLNMNRQNLIKQQEESKEKIEKAKIKIQEHEARKGELKILIDAAKQYNSIRVKKQSEMISQYLDKVSLQFEKVTKDGEVKEDFKLLYEGREFNILSNAERIKAGLEISNLVMNVVDVRFPIFIDNAESITKFNKPDTQIIQAIVIEGQELKIE
jgi:chromosome segregation ATPase